MLMRESFNPRTPCGVRLGLFDAGNEAGKFQSTHSLRSATIGIQAEDMAEEVSIQALLGECDHARIQHAQQPVRFNPRTPCGVRLFIFI